MRTRKTANVVEILRSVNMKLARTTCPPHVRLGMISVLETVLHDAGMYAGFGYLSADDMERNGHADYPGGQKPGIRYAYADGSPATAEEWVNGRNVPNHLSGEVTQSFPDDSRRYYYVHPSISADYREAAPIV